MKKLLFVINSLEGHGGSERSICLRANYLIEKYGYKIDIVTTTLDANCSYYPLNSKITLTNVPTTFSGNAFINKLSSILSTSSQEVGLSNFIREHDFDICSSLGAESFLYKTSNRKFRKIKEQRFTYKKYQTWENCSFFKKIWRQIRFRRIVNTMKKMDFVVTLTEEDAAFWKMYTINAITIPNFINSAGIKQSSLVNKTIIATGRLEKEKDFASLIRAFQLVSQIHPNWKLEICGNGSLRDHLLNMVREYELERCVSILPATKDLFIKYQQASVYVHTAVYEGFGNSILEALAHGLPVVAFESVGGVKALIEDGNNGFLVKNRSELELADRMMMLIRDFDLRVRMGRSAIGVARRYEEDKIMSMWHDFYSKL